MSADDPQHRGPGDEAEPIARAVLGGLLGLGVGGVPLVQEDDQPGPGFGDLLGQALLLMGDPLSRVGYEQGDVGGGERLAGRCTE